MGSFDDLPAELVLMILSYETLTPREYYSLAVSSRRNASLAKPFLYSNISTNLNYTHTRFVDNERPLTALAALVVSLALRPGNTALVKRIRLEMPSDGDDNSPMCMLSSEDLDVLDDLSKRYLRGRTEWDRRLLTTRNNDARIRYSQAPWTPLVTLLLALSSQVEEIAVSSAHTTLDPIQHMVRNLPHKFPCLQRVMIDPQYKIRATRHGDSELILQDNLCWAKCPNLKQFSVHGAGCDIDRLHTSEHQFSNLLLHLPVGRRSLPLEELTLTDCLLPARSVSHLAGLCKRLSSLSVSWATGPLFHYLRFADLACSLRAHQDSLTNLKIDLSKVHYAFLHLPPPVIPIPIQDTFQIGNAAQQHNSPYTMGIGSLAAFHRLTTLEISLCVLGVFPRQNNNAKEIIDMLPPNLETLVLLPPTQQQQHGGQMSLEEVAHWIRVAGPARLKQLKRVNHVPIDDQSAVLAAVIAAPSSSAPSSLTLQIGGAARMAEMYQKVTARRNWPVCSASMHGLQLAGGP